MADGKGLLNMSSYDQSQKEEIANFNEASNENSVTRQRLISVTSLGKQQNVAGKGQKISKSIFLALHSIKKTSKKNLPNYIPAPLKWVKSKQIKHIIYTIIRRYIMK
jgi:hypothetical protein